MASYVATSVDFYSPPEPRFNEQRQQEQQQAIVTSPTDPQCYPSRYQHAQSLATTSLEPYPTQQHPTTQSQHYRASQQRPLSTLPYQLWTQQQQHQGQQRQQYGGGAQSYQTNLNNTPTSFSSTHNPPPVSPPSYPETFSYTSAEYSNPSPYVVPAATAAPAPPPAVPTPATPGTVGAGGEYYPPVQPTIPYEQRHKFNLNCLGQRPVLNHPLSGDASIKTNSEQTIVYRSPPSATSSASQNHAQGWPSTPCVQPSVPNANTYSSPPTSSIQQFGSHYHASPTPPQSSTPINNYQPNQAVKLEGASTARNVVFNGLPSSGSATRGGAAPIPNNGNTIAIAHKNPSPPARQVPFTSVVSDRSHQQPRVVKSSPSTPSADNNKRARSTKAKSTTPPGGGVFQFSPYQAARDTKGPVHRVDTARLVDGGPGPSSIQAIPVLHPVVHQTIHLTDSAEDTADKVEGASGKKGKKDSKPFLACEFCRLRKIACGPGPALPPDIEVPPGPRTCNQCHRRGHVCRFPEASRRGLRHGKPSRVVVYGPDNQFKIIDPEGIDDDVPLQWDDVQDLESQRPGATVTVKRNGHRGKGKGNGGRGGKSDGPIQFVEAVDTEILRDLVARGIIPPGDATQSPR